MNNPATFGMHLQAELEPVVRDKIGGSGSSEEQEGRRSRGPEDLEVARDLPLLANVLGLKMHQYITREQQPLVLLPAVQEAAGVVTV